MSLDFAKEMMYKGEQQKLAEEEWMGGVYSVFQAGAAYVKS